MKRAVITGMGPVSAVGVGVEDFTAALFQGRNGIGPIQSFSTANSVSKCGGEIRDFQVKAFLQSEKTYLDRHSEFALAAVSLALRHAGLDLAGENQTRIGIVMGTAFGCMATMRLFYAGVLEKGPRLAKPVLFPHTYANTSISLAAIEFGIKGMHAAVTSGAAASTEALLFALDLIRSGQTDVVLAGGAEALSAVLFEGYRQAGQLAPQSGGPELACPFDRRADGMILGEGAGMLVVEEAEHAARRGAPIFGELAGGAMTGADFARAPDGGSGAVARVMAQALADAHAEPRDVEYICAGANADPVLDQAEARGIRSIFGARGANVPVSSIKSMTGETLGAGGALQAIATLGAIAAGRVPPTLNFESFPIGMESLNVTAQTMAQPIALALVNSIDRGGGIVSLVLRKHPG